MLYVPFPPSLQNLEDLLRGRGIDVSHEAVRSWWSQFGPMMRTKTSTASATAVPIESVVPAFAECRQRKRGGQPHEVVTDHLRSHRTVMSDVGIANHQRTGDWLNNRAENSHRPLRRCEQAVLGFRQM